MILISIDPIRTADQFSVGKPAAPLIRSRLPCETPSTSGIEIGSNAMASSATWPPSAWMWLLIAAIVRVSGGFNYETMTARLPAGTAARPNSRRSTDICTVVRM